MISHGSAPPPKLSIVLSGLLVLGPGTIGCDGPNEKAGRAADEAAAALSGMNAIGEGPNERLGEARDQVERADARAADAAADALERQGDEMRARADLAADKLDAQARRLREAAAPDPQR